jgi:hypothetical protein
MPSDPFFTSDGTVDTGAVLSEAIPLARLVGLFAAVSLLPFVAGIAAFDANSLVGSAFVAVGQLVLAVGAGVVLLHVIVRARHLSAD